jgi:hypothetical protein
VSDQKDKKHSVKIHSSTLQLLYSKKKSYGHGKEPDYADLIEPAVRLHLGKVTPSAPPLSGKSPEEAMLRKILESGNALARRHAKNSLETALELIKGDH